MSDISLPETAVFIDGDWLHYTARRLNRDIDYARLWDALHEHYGADTPVYFFGSFDSQNREQVKFLTSLESLGYVVQVAKLKEKKDRVSIKGLDVNLAVQAALLPPEVKTIALISGDGDFVPLLEQLRRHGKTTIVITLPAASRALVNAADHHYINLEKMLDNLEYGKGLTGTRKIKDKVSPPKNLYVEKGEYFAPYLVVRKLFLSAKSNIVLVDPYVDDQVLQMIHLLPTTVVIHILTNRISPADFCIQVSKLRSEGYQISVRKSNSFHDRFLCVDNEWWHSGHSFKDLGGKDSLINKVEEDSTLKKLRQRVEHELDTTNEYCS